MFRPMTLAKIAKAGVGFKIGQKGGGGIVTNKPIKVHCLFSRVSIRRITTSPKLLNNAKQEDDKNKWRSEDDVAADILVALAKAGANKVQTMSEQEEKLVRKLIVREIFNR